MRNRPELSDAVGEFKWTCSAIRLWDNAVDSSNAICNNIQIANHFTLKFSNSSFATREYTIDDVSTNFTNGKHKYSLTQSLEFAALFVCLSVCKSICCSSILIRFRQCKYWLRVPSDFYLMDLYLAKTNAKHTAHSQTRISQKDSAGWDLGMWYKNKIICRKLNSTRASFDAQFGHQTTYAFKLLNAHNFTSYFCIIYDNCSRHSHISQREFSMICSIS